MKVAVLVDGSFFIKRYRVLFKNKDPYNASEIAKKLHWGIIENINRANKHNIRRELYRIFYYDCPPLEKRLQNPVTKKGFDSSKSKEAIFRKQLFDELKKSRKLALRLGRLADNGAWLIRPDKTKEILNQKINVSELVDKDVYYNVNQKGVDMKIGLDIASLAYKKAVDQIILIAGDSDFVPAAKLARREGIDFVLDPMWNHINPDLYEHIDGLASSWPKPK